MKSKTKNSIEPTAQDGTGVPGWSEQHGTRLREVCFKIGSQRKAAELIGLNENMVAKYIRGKVKLPFYAAAILCKEAGVSLDWLNTGVEHNPAPQKNIDLSVAAVSLVLESLLEHNDRETLLNNAPAAAKTFIETYKKSIQMMQENKITPF